MNGHFSFSDLDPPEQPLTFDEMMAYLEDEEEEKEEPVPIALKYDMGWQKRSSGRKYDSASGVGAMIGNETGKIVDYGVKSKDCRICAFWENKNEEPPVHECYKNHFSSSRSMESAVAGEIVQRLEAGGEVKLRTLVMDDDSTTIARIRSELGRDVEKWSDVLHVKRHLQGALYKLQARHKALTTETIRYLLDKCFSYAVHQNKNKPKDLEKALKAIVPHAFGDHSQCGSWCQYLADPASYRHKYLPNGRDLHGDHLQSDLSQIFDDLSKNAQKIAPCASTNANESLNNMVRAHANKAHHLCGSGSLKARVDCTVALKNEGDSYLTEVYKQHGLSPGQFYKKHAGRMDNRRSYNREYQASVAVKRRKLNFSRNKSAAQKANELREGTSYESNIDSAPVSAMDIQVIPQPVDAPVYKKIEDKENINLVYFDLETTSLARDCDIIQLAAVHGEQTFDRYVMPEKEIDRRASDATGLSVRKGKLYYGQKPVETIEVGECLKLFLDWCTAIGKVVLVAHNCKNFDAVRLLFQIRKYQQSDKLACIVGFVDTLPCFKEYCKQKGLKWPNYKQTTIVQEILGNSYNAHNALEDAGALQEAVTKSGLPLSTILSHSFQTQAVTQGLVRDDNKEVNVLSFAPLIENKICSQAMVNKMAASGLHLDHVELAYQRDNEDGIRSLLAEKVPNGRVRVTSSKNIILSVLEYCKSKSK